MSEFVKIIYFIKINDDEFLFFKGWRYIYLKVILYEVLLINFLVIFFNKKKNVDEIVIKFNVVLM